MAQLIVRQIEGQVVRKLKALAGERGISVEEQHRRILRQVLLGKAKEQPSFKKALLSMPNAGDDQDFARGPQLERSVRL